MIKEDIENIIERDNLKEYNRKREVIYKKVILARLLKQDGLTHDVIGKMFNRDHSTSVHWKGCYWRYNIYKDFLALESQILKELNIKTREEIFDESLTKRVLLCDNYYEMVQLQIKVREELGIKE